MSDYTVDQALAEVQSLVFCRCHPSYKGRGLHDPNCDCDGAEAVQVVTARIEELEADLREARMQSIADGGQAQMAYKAQLEAEAKLAKAVEALDEAIYMLAPDERDMEKKAGVYRIVTAYEELKGE